MTLVSRDSLCSAVALMIAAAGFSVPAAAQKTFEGTITYDVTTTDKQVQVSISSRGQQVRQDFRLPPDAPPEAETYQLFDYVNGSVTTVLPGMKKYMVTNLKTLREAMGQGGEPKDDDVRKAIADIAPTHRKETIAGFECEVYALKSTPGDEWCLTTGLGHFLYFEGATGVGAGTSMAGLMKKFKSGAVVLRMQMKSKRGESMSMIATRVDRTLPDAQMFVVPSTFQEANPLKP